MPTTDSDRHVVVTTAHRGVFFGRLLKDQSPDYVELAEARMCLYWTAVTRGVLGLAAQGPGRGCRISPAPPRIKLLQITAIMVCTPDAVKAWRTEPWT